MIIGLLLSDDNIYTEARRGKPHKSGGPLGKLVHKIKRKASVTGRKLLDKPPKHRSRFDKYPIYIMRYHQFIWKRFFRRYLNKAGDGRPSLPSPKCWSIRCWMRRNKFKRYWKWRARIPIEGKNSPPFLHRRCRIPGTHGSKCKNEHLRHDYYWRMFMWIGRYGFPKPPQRKRICITSYCRLKKRMWSRYWKNFWIYTSLVPTIRPYDFNWRFWLWKNHGNQMRLQQVISPALMAMGIRTPGMMGGGMVGGGMMGGMMGGMNGGRYLTVEMKQALLLVMQRNLAQTMQLASTSQYTLQRQRLALMMLMRMPAYPSALSAQMQMQAMMRNMHYQQYMQQYRMQQMIQQQMYGMARYLRGSCGCGVCSASTGMHGTLPHGTSMYYNHGGAFTPLSPNLMGRHMTGIRRGTMPMMPVHPVSNQMELKMRVQALYAKNNLPIY